MAEQNLVIIFGSDLRGDQVASLVKFGSGIAGAKFICLGDYANSRGAADMGLYPDLLPGYQAVSDTTHIPSGVGSASADRRPDFAGDGRRREGWKTESAVRRGNKPDRRALALIRSPSRKVSSWCRTCS